MKIISMEREREIEKDELEKSYFLGIPFQRMVKAFFIGLQRWFKLLTLMVSYEVP